MNTLMLTIFSCLLSLSSFAAQTTLKHELASEKSDQKTYTVGLDLWTTEAADSLEAAPRTDATDLVILTGSKVWTLVKTGKKYRFEAQVQNTGQETRTLFIDFKRTAKNRVEIKTITIRVPVP